MASRQRPAGGRRLESAALVEQLHVEVQDPLADDVEAEVPGLDHAGMNRPDGDLVGVVTGDRNGPGIERRAVIDQWPQRFVADEPHAVEVGGFALVPGRRRDLVDDALDCARGWRGR